VKREPPYPAAVHIPQNNWQVAIPTGRAILVVAKCSHQITKKTP